VAEERKALVTAQQELATARQSVEQQAAEHTQRLTALQNSLEAREKKVTQREQEVAKRELDVGNASDALARAKQQWQETSDIAANALNDKITAAEATLADLAARDKVLAQREAKVKAAAAMVN
jgi:uncharacterized protein (DUF3084 family)